MEQSWPVSIQPVCGRTTQMTSSSSGLWKHLKPVSSRHVGLSFCSGWGQNGRVDPYDKTKHALRLPSGFCGKRDGGALWLATPLVKTDQTAQCLLMRCSMEPRHRRPHLSSAKRSQTGLQTQLRLLLTDNGYVSVQRKRIFCFFSRYAVIPFPPTTKVVAY